MVNWHEEKYVHEKFLGKILDYTKKSRYFGEMGVVFNIVNVKYKKNNKGIACMFLGNAKTYEW